MTKQVLVIAGMPLDIFDRFAAVSSKRFVENGVVIARPLRAPYSAEYASVLIERARKYALNGHPLDRIAFAVVYVDNGDPGIPAFLQEFFPFALPIPVPPFLAVPEGLTSKQIDHHYDRQVSRLVRHTVEARRRLNVLSSATIAANMSPLILPVSNFRNKHFLPMLKILFHEAGTAPDLEGLLNRLVKGFKAQSPMAKIDGEERSCFADQFLYFKSPGNHRHGVYQYDADEEHTNTCLLRSKSRIGGSLDPTFHFDCQPKTRLKKRYPDCHGRLVPPKERHLNIAPNDGIIGK